MIDTTQKKYLGDRFVPIRQEVSLDQIFDELKDYQAESDGVLRSSSQEKQAELKQALICDTMRLTSVQNACNLSDSISSRHSLLQPTSVNLFTAKSLKVEENDFFNINLNSQKYSQTKRKLDEQKSMQPG